jgi:hypothetical protein
MVTAAEDKDNFVLTYMSNMERLRKLLKTHILEFCSEPDHFYFNTEIFNQLII